MADSAGMSPAPGGFHYRSVGDDVVITHLGRRTVIVRGVVAKQFLADVEDDDPQKAGHLQDGPQWRCNSPSARRRGQPAFSGRPSPISS